MSNRRKFLVIAGFFALLLIETLFFQNATYKPTPNCRQKDTVQRDIVKSDFKLQALWSLYIELSNESPYPPLTTAGNMLIAAQSCNQVIAFDIASGNVAWRTDYIPTADSLAVDTTNHQIYVTAQEQIRALSVSEGKTLWINTATILQKNAPPVMVVPNGDVIAYARYAGIRHVDPLQGTLSDPIHVPEGTFLIYKNIAFGGGGGVIKAVDQSSDELLWTSRISQLGFVDVENLRPDVQSNLLMLRQVGNLEQPIVLDINTGKSLWKGLNDSIVSNIAIQDDKAYMLTADAKLLVLNAQDGSEVGSISFTPPFPAELLYGEGGIGGSWISVQNDLIALYFQDTNMLYVFKTALSH